jgi:hypothetical protein
MLLASQVYRLGSAWHYLNADQGTGRKDWQPCWVSWIVGGSWANGQVVDFAEAGIAEHCQGRERNSNWEIVGTVGIGAWRNCSLSGTACSKAVGSSCWMGSWTHIRNTAAAAACSLLATSHLSPFAETQPSGTEACCSYPFVRGASYCSGLQPHSHQEVVVHLAQPGKELDWRDIHHP